MHGSAGTCSVVKAWREADSVLYRVALDGMEFAYTVRISGTQKATHGESLLLAWCVRHANQLRETATIDADLNEEEIR